VRNLFTVGYEAGYIPIQYGPGSEGMFPGCLPTLYVLPYHEIYFSLKLYLLCHLVTIFGLLGHSILFVGIHKRCNIKIFIVTQLQQHRFAAIYMYLQVLAGRHVGKRLMVSKGTEQYVLSVLQEDRNVKTITYQLMHIGFRGAVKNCS
jgi:hypothetical protein